MAARAQHGAAARRPDAIRISFRRTGVRSRTSSPWWSIVPRARTSASGRGRPTRRATNRGEAQGARRRRPPRRRDVARELDTEGTLSRRCAARFPTRRPTGSAAGVRDHRRGSSTTFRSRRRAGFNAPVHALITGHEGELQRRIGSSRRRARHRRQGRGHRSPCPRQRRSRRAGLADGPPRRPDDRDVDAKVGEQIEAEVPIDHPGRRDRAGSRAGRRRACRRQQRAVVNIEHVRDSSAFCSSLADRTRAADVAQPVEVDANVDLVHFTILRPRKGRGRHADQRLSLTRSVAVLFGRRIKDFDLIIFDRYAQQRSCPTLLSTISSITCATAARS